MRFLGNVASATHASSGAAFRLIAFTDIVVHDLASADIAFRPIGPLRLKGFADPVTAFELL